MKKGSISRIIGIAALYAISTLYGCSSVSALSKLDNISESIPIRKAGEKLRKKVRSCDNLRKYAPQVIKAEDGKEYHLQSDTKVNSTQRPSCNITYESEDGGVITVERMYGRPGEKSLIEIIGPPTAAGPKSRIRGFHSDDYQEVHSTKDGDISIDTFRVDRNANGNFESTIIQSKKENNIVPYLVQNILDVNDDGNPDYHIKDHWGHGYIDRIVEDHKGDIIHKVILKQGEGIDHFVESLGKSKR